LNLASRLMDLARPRGVVFDADFGPALLPEDLRGKFRQEEVFLKGVAPATGMIVYCWPDELVIPSFHLRPLGEKKWEKTVATMTRTELQRLEGTCLRYQLRPAPGPDPEVFCLVSHDSVTPGGRKSARFRTTEDMAVELAHRGAQAHVEIERSTLLKYLDEARVGPTWPVRIEISYRSL
jgi:hypothetical protein